MSDNHSIIPFVKNGCTLSPEFKNNVRKRIDLNDVNGALLQITSYFGFQDHWLQALEFDKEEYLTLYGFRARYKLIQDILNDIEKDYGVSIRNQVYGLM